MKQKKTDEELIRIFWESHAETLFNEKTIALVRNLAVTTLQKERCAKVGPKFLKILGSVLYKKYDVIEFIEGFK